MTVASKTLLQQMRFVRCGAPFCTIAAKPSINAQNFDFSYQGNSFYGPSNETTPVYTSYVPSPIRRGASGKIIALRQIANGGIYQGGPIYSNQLAPVYTSYAPNPVRRGNAFKWLTAKSTIDASSDFYQQGAPFYVPYAAAPPVTFNATRFFLVM